MAAVVMLRCGARVAEVGRCLGNPANTVSRWLSHAARRRMMGRAFGRRVDGPEAEPSKERRMNRQMLGSSAIRERIPIAPVVVGQEELAAPRAPPRVGGLRQRSQRTNMRSSSSRPASMTQPSCGECRLAD